ncbi:fumarylacetoacetate hydrolase family protein [Arthrobacter sp. AB6]|uniref:fumarylacetoacetate hydrolase family protein n=1 Tax=Arthrobacter sp. AB6 TaxID=2962570 RepID=UPI0028810303|nr:fumarylacetoacetate hydrolase family protein [Arthrobacter sp. AB6]MDT0196738.1 fumarylacetoacetate hydrolase family protein [Arthrobacter sp. AB6]
MKIARIAHQGHSRLAVEDHGVWNILIQTDLAGVVAGGEQQIDSTVEPQTHPNLLAPYPGGTIFGIGLNYKDTITDMGFPTPATPYLFPKLSSSVVGPGEPIVIDPDVTVEPDWEGELAVIIGKTARNVPEESALDFVFGYTAANDISARDVQRADPQWVRGKGLDTFCPIGPVIVTADEIPDPQDLRIRTWVNGEIVQDGNTADMLFGVKALISYLSRHFTLRPGDVILSGTPSGCGGFMTPPRFLSPGDETKVEVQGIGSLINPVAAAPVPMPWHLAPSTATESTP